MITKNADKALLASREGAPFVLFNGSCLDLIEAMDDHYLDLTLTSPPYFMGKSYDTSYKVDDFVKDHSRIAPEIARVTKIDGSIAWQVGHHVKGGVCVPLDFLAYSAFNQVPGIKLRNRIIWSFGHGVHSARRFSGRHESVLWFTQSERYFFDLDAVRVPQKYRGKKYYKGPNKGQWSSNPLGKNPGDVWEIPNVKANHVEKTDHPCQFPIALAQRLIRALSPAAGVIFDPFSGSGSAGLAAVIEGRRFIGAELSGAFCQTAERRFRQWEEGKLGFRPLEKPIYEPNPRSTVARDPFIVEEEIKL
ncbi:site-specific DNA-methyltransferase [Fulvimarina sp. MAC3]|uniref:DNA-methyltransferase n=1 Tax=Fulvimarina sp. MAC3 TaxID=3148887 RepID=UPI0031FC311D